MPILRNAFVVAALALTTGAAAAAAQQPGAELNQVMASRQDLENLAVLLEQAAQSGPYTGEVRARMRAQAQRVRERLANGDFQVGDRIYLRVEQETSLTDTFTVRGGREILLPAIGPVPLAGVLRVELADFLRERLAQFVRNPQVRAHALIRIGVYGGVVRQGYYTVPVDIAVDEVFRIAGGISPIARMDRIRVERGEETLYDGDYMQQVITEGRTLDELSIQAGDKFVIPQPGQSNVALQRVQTIQMLLGIPLTIFALVRLFQQ